ncbi:MAG TPA: DNA translocase FtsK [Dehalococcoidia bacterium]|nr:DNA translocase FtsK [Dehalococcoidia bacterium]
MVAAGLAVALALSLSGVVRAWVVDTLFYAWVPVSLWAIALVFTVRHHHRSLAAGWRYWLLGGGAVAIMVGVLSMFRPGSGISADMSLGGHWGAVLGGDPLGLAVVKLLAIAVILPPALFPKSVGITWVRALGKIGHESEIWTRWFSVARLVSVKDGVARYVRLRRDRTTPERPSRRLTARTERVVDPELPLISSDIEAFAKGELSAYLEPESGARTGATSRLFPNIGVLSNAKSVGPDEAEFEETARLIEKTLGSYGVQVEVQDIQVGPRLVRYGLLPGWLGRGEERSEEEKSGEHRAGNRVRVQSILAREKDLALALKTEKIRIQPNIPGKSLVGLEAPVPNPIAVGLRQIVESERFTEVSNEGGLPIALGQNVGGHDEVLDLKELPHLLIAGATGTGKSVCLNTIVASMLLTNSNEQVRLLMVDPKGVELTPYDGIPHLISPVISDPADFGPALEGLIQVMQQRYQRFRDVSARDIRSYNDGPYKPMPSLVVVVDELAELMLSEGRDAESKLVRLAQLGRAAGIHLVLSTQRPTVDVVTGLLKANIPTRICFAVASQVDSRVILDMNGGEDLMGRGDMLLLTKESTQPRRIQGAYVEEKEIAGIVDFWINQPLPMTIENAPEVDI